MAQPTQLTGTVVVVVRRVNVDHQLTRAVCVQIIFHAIGLHVHLLAHPLEGRCRNHVALAVHLPGDGGEGRANLIVALRTGGRSGVDGQIDSFVTGGIYDHPTEEVGVVVFFVVNHDKGLRLHSNIVGNILRS